jgi:hypothetical protein
MVFRMKSVQLKFLIRRKFKEIKVDMLKELFKQHSAHEALVAM